MVLIFPYIGARERTTVWYSMVMPSSLALHAVASFPFADTTELSTFLGRRRMTLEQELREAREAGYVRSIRHSTPLTASTRRHTLTERGIAAMGIGARGRQLSARWLRLMLERLDPLAYIYRTIEAICDQLGETVAEFRFYSTGNLDAAVLLRRGLSVGLARYGGIWGRSGYFDRIARSCRTGETDVLLALVPNDYWLRRLRERIDREEGQIIPALGAVEEEVVRYEDALWSGLWVPEEQVELGELAPRIAVRGRMPSVSVFRSEAPPPDDWPPDLPAVSLRPRQKALLDLIASWPRITRRDLAEMMGLSEMAVKKLLNSASMRRLCERGRHGRRLTFALSEEGIRYIARRDRASHGFANAAWLPGVGRTLSNIDSQAEHSAGIHRFVALLTRQASVSAAWSLNALEPDWRVGRAWYDYQNNRRILRPDGLGELEGPDGPIHFLLEYERRTRHPSDVWQRVERYLEYFRDGEWRQHWPTEPLSLFVFEDVGMETQFLLTVETTWGVRRIRTSCLSILERAGPLGAAWRVPGGNYELIHLRS